MSELISTLQYYFSYPFVRYAMIVGLLVALCASLLGVTLVLKRFSFIGDGLSHVAFGAMAAAAVTGITDRMIIIMPVTVLSAVLLLRTGKNTKIKGDASIAMISVSALAIGYILMNVFPVSSNISADVCGSLFGSTSILNLKSGDVWLCFIMSAIVLIFFTLFYNKIFSVTFDESFSKATGINSDLYNLMIAVVTAVIIVIAMNLVGSLLISALIIFPALSAMRLFKSFKSVTICAAIISVVCAGLGIILSILLSTPVGATIVAADLAAFLVFSGISTVCARK
ncbi:MAG: metal ABC transporter permease [Ruminococcus sp.]|nr:metal ABC transporter permease [Ruminococcus sp.]